MYEILDGHGVVPVVELDRVEDALPLADALSKGGINIMEITFRTEAAADSIYEISQNRPDILVGAGTVVNLEQLDQAINAGAKFIVSPGLSKDIVEESLKRGVLPLPGVITPTEVIQAMDLGLRVLKYFPASVFGGLKALGAYSGVFKDVKFMPTGGVNAENLEEYLKTPNIIACGGSWMVKPDMVRAGDWEQITKLSRQARDIYEGVNL